VSTTRRISLTTSSWSQINFANINGNQPVMRRPSILKLCPYLEENF
jgi:hypothetical protein